MDDHYNMPAEAHDYPDIGAQNITVFHVKRHRQGKGQHPFVDADAAFVLAFSVILLNTDLHNPQVSFTLWLKFLVVRPSPNWQ